MSIRIGNKIIANNTTVTPAVDATDTVAGIIRIATNDEVLEGTNTNTAITPFQLANAASKTNVDNQTIVKDDEDNITAVGIKSKTNDILYDWIGTTAEYEAGVANNTILSNWICWVTDDEEDLAMVNYNHLSNIPKINGVQVKGAKSLADYNLLSATEIESSLNTKANISWYPDKDFSYTKAKYLSCDKQTLVIEAGTTIKVNNEVISFDTPYSYNLASKLDAGTSLVNGKDYCIYLTDTADIVVSLNSTYPVGYTQTDTRKIGGFHTLCAAVTSANAPTLPTNSFWTSHPAIGYNAGDAIPNSTWTLAHRPYSEPNGMVYIDGKYGSAPFWVDIYLQSGILSGARSTYNGTLTNNRMPIMYTWDLLLNRKKLPSDQQFLIFAEGSNQKTSISGSAIPDPKTTGGHLDTAGKRMISGLFIEECCGYVWQWLDELGPAGGSEWNQYTDTSRGGNYGSQMVLIAGGSYSDSTNCGSWSRASHAGRRGVGAGYGARGVSLSILNT